MIFENNEQTVGKRFLESLQISHIEQEHLCLLSRPQYSFKFNIPLQKDNGKTELIEAWRIVYCDATGPTKGGVRFCPDITEQNLSTVAFRILLKAAAYELPHGGACGGVKINPHSLSPSEKERLSRAYVNALAELIGQNKDILSPDLGTNAQVMSWMSDQFNQIKGSQQPAAINGKLPGQGGILGREDATGLGATTVLQTILSKYEEKINNLSYVIQGAGSAGGKLALLLHQIGARIIAMSDSSGGWYREEGLDITEIMENKSRGIPFAEMDIQNAETISCEEILKVKADCIAPAATAELINETNVQNINCKFLLEIANNPVASGLDHILEAKGITIIPDIIANAGGIIVSHFEWAQNLQGLRWSESQVHERLKAKITETTLNLLSISESKNISLPIAAQLLALDRISNALI